MSFHAKRLNKGVSVKRERIKGIPALGGQETRRNQLRRLRRITSEVEEPSGLASQKPSEVSCMKENGGDQYNVENETMLQSLFL